MKHIDKVLAGEHEGAARVSAGYFWKRVRQFYPQYIMSLLIIYLYFVICEKSLSVCEILRDYIGEICMVQNLGFGEHANPAMWYVSALIFASTLVCYAAMRNRDGFLYLIAPAVVLILYSRFYQYNNNLEIGWLYMGWACEGLLRALAGICLGCVCYGAYQRFLPLASRYRRLRTLMEAAILGFILYYFHGNGNSVVDFTVTAMLAVFVISVALSNDMDEGSYLSCFLNRRNIDPEYAWAIYTNHWVVNAAIKYYLPGYPFYIMLAVYLLAVCILSFITVKCLRIASGRERNILVRLAPSVCVIFLSAAIFCLSAEIKEQRTLFDSSMSGVDDEHSVRLYRDGGCVQYIYIENDTEIEKIGLRVATWNSKFAADDCLIIAFSAAGEELQRIEIPLNRILDSKKTTVRTGGLEVKGGTWLSLELFSTLERDAEQKAAVWIGDELRKGSGYVVTGNEKTDYYIGMEIEGQILR